MTTPTGIPFVDLSSNHRPEHTDWRAIAASGVRYAYLRGCEGVTPDTAYTAHRDAARNAGVKVGVYAFYRARHSPYENTGALFDVMGDDFDLPPCIDLEAQEADDVLTPEDLEHHVSTGLTEIRLRTGVDPILYTGPGFVASRLPADHRLGQYALWNADYREHPSLPRGWTSAIARQWTGTGRVAGVPGNADQSVWLCSHAELDAMTR